MSTVLPFHGSLTKDMTGKEDNYRGPAVRALCQITDVSSSTLFLGSQVRPCPKHTLGYLQLSEWSGGAGWECLIGASECVYFALRSTASMPELHHLLLLQSTMLQAVERYMKQAIVDKVPSVSSSALVSSLVCSCDWDLQGCGLKVE